jgi:hypothetical protein
VNNSEKTKLTQHLNANWKAVRDALKANNSASAAKQENYKAIRQLLRELGIAGTDPNVKEAAPIIAKGKPPGVATIILHIEDPGPEIDVPAEIRRIKGDVGHAHEFTELDGAPILPSIYVQLDCDQLKHQPKSVPIGTREKGGGEKFGTYATKEWHADNTMRYMARWARDLRGMVEGRKVEHGQSERVQIDTSGPTCFEGYAMLLGGKKYVSFHCYPNSR